MKIFSPSSPKHPTDDIPDPWDWIEEHRSLACVARTLSALNETPDDRVREGEDYCYTADGELAIAQKTRELLKADCGDRCWRYVQDYF